jgi:glycosyltransferase involved in cell wall biosynthesis
MQELIQEDYEQSDLTVLPNRKEILIICLARGLGGSTRSLVTVLEGLEPNFRRILCCPDDGSFGRLVAKRDLTEYRLDVPNRGVGLKGKLSRIEAMIRIARWMRRHHRFVSAIHANGPEELNIAAPIARIWGVRLVVWSHARDVSPWMRRMTPVLRMILKGTDVHFAAVSESARSVLAEAGLVDPGDVEIIANPIDASDVVANTKSRSDRMVVGFLGSDQTYKGLQFLPDLIDSLREAPIHWKVFSNERSGQNKPAWDRLKSFPPEVVSFPGKLSEVRDAYAQCDVVFMPSLEESFGRVAAEAMLNGLPVVASDLPAVRSVLGDGAAGLLFPPGDVSVAAEALENLLTDEKLRRDLGNQGKLLASAFAPAGVVAQLTHLYRG